MYNFSGNHKTNAVYSVHEPNIVLRQNDLPEIMEISFNGNWSHCS